MAAMLLVGPATSLSESSCVLLRSMLVMPLGAFRVVSITVGRSASVSVSGMGGLVVPVGVGEAGNLKPLLIPSPLLLPFSSDGVAGVIGVV